MIKLPSKYGLAAAAVVLTILVAGLTWAQESGSITSVYVAPDARNVLLKYEGAMGRHAAFVMQRPSRLVVDFDATQLGTVPRKIRVGEDPIQEVRLGQSNGRARLVVDFGDHPVPSFQVQRGPNLVSISLGDADDAPSVPSQTKPQARSNVPPARRLPAQNVPAAREEQPIRVKAANIKDDLVCVELSDPKDPKSRYRLIVNLDVKDLRVKNAALSDARGNTKRFDLADAEGPSPDSSDGSGRAAVGPRKDSLASDAEQVTAKPKYKWGMPATDAGGPPSQVAKAGPLRIEAFELRPRNP